jgi:hypothetical protein
MAFAALLRKVRSVNVSGIERTRLIDLTASTPGRGSDGRIRYCSHAKRIRRGEDRGRQATGRRQDRVFVIRHIDSRLHSASGNPSTTRPVSPQYAMSLLRHLRQPLDSPRSLSQRVLASPLPLPHD